MKKSVVAYFDVNGTILMDDTSKKYTTEDARLKPLLTILETFLYRTSSDSTIEVRRWKGDDDDEDRRSANVQVLSHGKHILSYGYDEMEENLVKSEFEAKAFRGGDVKVCMNDKFEYYGISLKALYKMVSERRGGGGGGSGCGGGGGVKPCYIPMKEFEELLFPGDGLIIDSFLTPIDREVLLPVVKEELRKDMEEGEEVEEEGVRLSDFVNAVIRLNKANVDPYFPDFYSSFMELYFARGIAHRWRICYATFGWDFDKLPNQDGLLKIAYRESKCKDDDSTFPLTPFVMKESGGGGGGGGGKENVELVPLMVVARTNEEEESGRQFCFARDIHDAGFYDLFPHEYLLLQFDYRGWNRGISKILYLHRDDANTVILAFDDNLVSKGARGIIFKIFDPAVKETGPITDDELLSPSSPFAHLVKVYQYAGMTICVQFKNVLMMKPVNLHYCGAAEQDCNIYFLLEKYIQDPRNTDRSSLGMYLDMDAFFRSSPVNRTGGTGTGTGEDLRGYRVLFTGDDLHGYRYRYAAAAAAADEPSLLHEMRSLFVFLLLFYVCRLLCTCILYHYYY